MCQPSMEKKKSTHILIGSQIKQQINMLYANQNDGTMHLCERAIEKANAFFDINEEPRLKQIEMKTVIGSFNAASNVNVKLNFDAMFCIFLKN